MPCQVITHRQSFTMCACPGAGDACAKLSRTVLWHTQPFRHASHAFPCVTEERLSGGCLHPGGCQEQSSFCLRWRWCMELPSWAPTCAQCCPQTQMCTSPLPGPRARSCPMWQTLTAGERLVQPDRESRQSPAQDTYGVTDWSQAQCVRRCLSHLAVLMQAWPLLMSTRCSGQI